MRLSGRTLKIAWRQWFVEDGAFQCRLSHVRQNPLQLHLTFVRSGTGSIITFIHQRVSLMLNRSRKHPMEFTGSTQNSKKNIRTPNLPVRTKIFPKKVCLVPYKKGGKNSCGSYPTEFAGSTQNPKKIMKHQIYQSEQTFSQKNYISYLKNVKKPKTRIGATRRNLQAQP
jgi:hypothetical protein